MKSRYNLFIDGQNVPLDYISLIMEYCAETGLEQEDARLYASTDEISRIVAKSGTLLADYDIDPVPVPCKPKKNSVDIRIAVDIIEEAVEDTDSDVVIVATNDSDFTHVASRVISYKSEFHLLHTGSAPTGYSERVKMTQLKAFSKREQIADQVRKVTAILLPGKTSGKKNAVKQKVFILDQEYSNDAPMLDLSAAGFAMRIMAASPIIVDSRWLFYAWKDFSGNAWKGRNSKKSAQQFFDEVFPIGLYRFVEWNEKTVNSGYFLHRDYASIEVARGYSNTIVSLLGADASLLDRQCEVIAEAMRGSGYENFNCLYDASRENNVLPRYAAWAIVEAWLRRRDAENPPRWMDAIDQYAFADGAMLRVRFDAEIRRQVEAGEIALEPNAGQPDNIANGSEWD